MPTKITIVLALAICFVNAHAADPDAKSYLESALVGASVASRDVRRVSASCEYLVFNGGSDSVAIPTKKVNVRPSETFGSLSFECINGGGCISSGGSNNTLYIGGLPSGVPTSLSKAFTTFQAQCGGPEKRPF